MGKADLSGSAFFFEPLAAELDGYLKAIVHGYRRSQLARTTNEELSRPSATRIRPAPRWLFGREASPSETEANPQANQRFLAS